MGGSSGWVEFGRSGVNPRSSHLAEVRCANEHELSCGGAVQHVCDPRTDWHDHQLSSGEDLEGPEANVKTPVRVTYSTVDISDKIPTVGT